MDHRRAVEVVEAAAVDESTVVSLRALRAVVTAMEVPVDSDALMIDFPSKEEAVGELQWLPMELPWI